MPQAAGTNRVAAAVALIGGALLVIGVFLRWIAISTRLQVSTPPDTVTGIHFGGGIIALVAGVIVAAAGLMLLVIPLTPGWWTGLSLAALVTGVVGLGISVIAMANKSALLDNTVRAAFRQQAGRDIPTALLHLAERRAGLTASLGVGIFLSAAGGALGLVAGLVGLGSRPTRAAPAPLASTSFPAPQPDLPPAPQTPDPASQAPPPPPGQP